MLHDIVNWLLETVRGWDYWGILILMALESTVLPIPSELVLIPAGYLSYQGEMNFALILAASILGGLFGSSINYAFALWVGRPFLERWGKYFFVRAPLLHKTDAFFVRHGAVSVFTGRLIPGIRHLISLPAGVSRMRFGKFAFYTCVGAGLWSLILAALGYLIGGNEALVQQYLKEITLALFITIAAGLYVYWRVQRNWK